MDFDFKKARKHKQKQDKARSTHRHHPDQKSKHPANEVKQQTSSGTTGDRGHATPLQNNEKPTSYTETDPMQFQHLKRETEDIAALTSTKSYSRRAILSNWERYELPPETPESDKGEALDFETIIQSLSDAKGHFKLKHEQSWENERSELQEDIFKMDMHKLFASLERVPYHIRQNLPATLFTPEQLAVFDQEAEEARKRSCFSKLTSNETYLSQKLPSAIVSATVGNDENKPGDVIASINAPVETICNSADRSTEEAFSTPTAPEENLSHVSENDQTTNLLEKTVSNTPCPKSDELDLDYLLSLDAAAAEKPKSTKSTQQVDTLVMTAATSSTVSETGKLDDWLDDLLDD